MAPTTTNSKATTTSPLDSEVEVKKDKRAHDRARQRLLRKQHYLYYLYYKGEGPHPRPRTGRPTHLTADLKDTDTPSWLDEDTLVLGWDTILLPLDEDLGEDYFEWDDTVGFSELYLGDIMRTEGCRVRSARRRRHRKGQCFPCP